MTNRNRLIAFILSTLVVAYAIYWFAHMIRPLPAAVAIGPLKFHVIAVSNRVEERVYMRFPAEQVWITVQIDPSDARRSVSSLELYMDTLFANMELVGPDGSRQKQFFHVEQESVAWYDRIRKIGHRSYLQMSFCFDNKAHWKTGTLTAYFDKQLPGQRMGSDQMAVVGKTLRLGPVVLQ